MNDNQQIDELTKLLVMVVETCEALNIRLPHHTYINSLGGVTRSTHENDLLRRIITALDKFDHPQWRNYKK